MTNNILYTTRTLNQIILRSNSLEFFFLRDKKASWHFFNGLRKNLTSLEDARLTVKGTPEIIAISERKLKEKETFIILAYRGLCFRLLIHEQVQEV